MNYKFDGLQVTFQLVPEAGLVPALFDNFAWMDAGQIDSQLRAKIPLYKGKLAAASGLEQQVIEQLTALATAQHLNASVMALPLIDTKSGKTTADSFRLATPTVVISELSFDGASPEQVKNLDAVAKAAVGQDYSVSASAENLSTAIVNVYRNQGFLDADVTRVGNDAPTITPDRIAVPMKATVNEGGQYHVGKMTLAGSVLMTQEDFAKKALLKPGDVANQELLRRSLMMVGSPYKTKGYLRAHIKASPKPDAATHVVDYEIDVTPGDIFHMGKLELLNVSETQRAKLLSIWKMHPGDPYDETYTILFLKTNATVLHEFDGMSASYKQAEHEDTHVVDLSVSFQKGGTLN